MAHVRCIILHTAQGARWVKEALLIGCHERTVQHQLGQEQIWAGWQLPLHRCVDDTKVTPRILCCERLCCVPWTTHTHAHTHTHTHTHTRTRRHTHTHCVWAVSDFAVSCERHTHFLNYERLCCVLWITHTVCCEQFSCVLCTTYTLCVLCSTHTHTHTLCAVDGFAVSCEPHTPAAPEPCFLVLLWC